MYEITITSTPDERYDGIIRAEMKPILADLNIEPAYTEGGAGMDFADNHYGFEVDEVTANRIAKTIRDRTGRTVTVTRPLADA